MIATSSLTEIGSFITSMVTAAVLLITTLATIRNGKNIKAGNNVGLDIQSQVTTLNGKTIAVLADENESRRIYAEPPEDRTQGDDEHIANVPPPS